MNRDISSELNDLMPQIISNYWVSEEKSEIVIVLLENKFNDFSAFGFDCQQQSSDSL